MTGLIAQASQRLFDLEACGGGWRSAPLLFAAGANKYRTATGSGIGLKGHVATVNGKRVCR